MASGTQNLSPAACNKIQNKRITGNGVAENDFASHLLHNIIITFICGINIKITPPYLRLSKSHSPHHNFQLLFILFL